MDAKLKTKVRDILEELAVVDDERYNLLTLIGNSSPLERTAADYLESKGCISKLKRSYVITAIGREYLDQLNTWGPWYWFKNNWFPAIVALATIIASVGTLVVQVLVALRG
jgi:hypothetical protein